MLSSFNKFLDYQKYPIIKDNEILYYLNQFIWYHNINENVMFNDIKPYEYAKIINKLEKYYENIESNYYTNLNNKLKQQNIYNNKIITNVNEYTDKLITEYIKCRKNIDIISIWPKAKIIPKKIDEFINILNKNGNIYYHKEIEISFYGAVNLLYQLYAGHYRMKTINNLNYKVSRIGWNINNKFEKKKMQVFVFEPNKDLDIRGSSCSFKSELRNIWLRDEYIPDNYKDLNTDEQDKYAREYDYLHINDYFYESIEYAQIYFNNNSLQLLHDLNLYRFLNKKYIFSRIMLNTYKKIINEYFDPVDSLRFMTMGSSVLYTHGLRNMNDIDCFIEHCPIKGKNSEFMININRFFKDKNKIGFIDASMKHTEEWTYWWEEFMNKVAKSCNSENIQSVCADPQFHYYFMGIKIIILDCDKYKRILRNRPASTADLIMINKLLKKKYFIPEIPNKTWDDIKVNRENFISTIVYYIKKRYEMNISRNEVIRLIKYNNKNNNKNNNK